jgi:nucleotide-binding universal stress UspA family protein
MSDSKQKIILVALDGSERSQQTVKYLTLFKPPGNMTIVLFNVFDGIPESYWDLEREPKSVKSVKYVRAWEKQKLKETEDFMEKARQTLVRSGYPEEKIKVKIQPRINGIARDILHQAQQGCEAVVCRRRGLGRLPGIILGSVSMKLLEKLSFKPLILAGRRPPGRKYMIAMDGSEGAMRAVKFVGSFLEGTDVEFCLMHVSRANEELNSDLSLPDTFVKNSEGRISKRFTKAKASLVANGFDAKNITSLIITGVHSRAATIVDEGRKADFGTIVMGRKGLSCTPDFSVGRVTQKVAILAREKSVWIVS